MNEQEFQQWLDGNRPKLKAWGDHVASTISELCVREIGAERFETFFKVAPVPRVKSAKSALNKLRAKNYADPLDQMTDLVGVRFVVLLRTDLELLDRMIMAGNYWVASRDRHFSDEIFDDPEVFDYQSVHYVVRATEECVVGDCEIPPNMACEIQVRTLMQHAYAELVHDNIYKPKVRVPESAKRLVARCVALMESTDDMFCRAVSEINQIVATREELFSVVEREFASIVKGDVNRDDAVLISDTYHDLLTAVSADAIASLAAKKVLRARIAHRAANGGLFSQPICLLVYWLITHHYEETMHRWPLPAYGVDLEQICSDLGFAGGR